MTFTGSIAELFSHTATKYSLAEKRPVVRWTMMLPGAGCEYWKKTKGGCTMCGFNASTEKYAHGRLYPAPFFRILYWLGERSVANIRPDELSIFNGGSFLNPNEIPAVFQRNLFESVARHDSLKRLMIESRCEYISHRSLHNALEALSGKKLKIAIGLESENDHTRNRLIRKGLSKTVFEETVRMSVDAGVDIQAYIFLKPVGLSEKEALEDTLKSIRYALSTGVAEIEISSAFVQPSTAMVDAYRRGEFRPPYLWSILEIIRQTQENGWPVSIGGFDDSPPPLAIPSNCPDCSFPIYNAIERFRQTRTLDTIPNCLCKTNWEELP